MKEQELATFNACAETVETKPFFRDAFTRRDGQLVTIAGLWDEWHERPVGEVIQSCTMVITAPNEFMGA